MGVVGQQRKKDDLTMRNQNNWINVSFYLLFLFLTIGSRAYALDSSSAHRIFILHSYGYGHVCGQPQHDGIIGVLKDS